MKISVFMLTILLCCQVAIASSEVRITAKYPAQVQAGGEIRVDVTLYKKSLQSFGRYTQQLPVGFTASEISSSGEYKFSFNEQTVEFLWFQLPSADSVQLSYKIKTPADVDGIYCFNGQFAYTIRNMRGTTSTPTSCVMVSQGKNDSVLPRCVRLKPFIPDNAKYAEVILLISKGTGSTGLYLHEQLPLGMAAKGISVQNALFVVNGGQIKIDWESNVPKDRFVVVRYMLAPADGRPINATDLANFGTLKGDLFAIKGTQMMNYDVIQGTYLNIRANQTSTSAITTAADNISNVATTNNTPTNNTASTNNATNTTNTAQTYPQRTNLTPSNNVTTTSTSTAQTVVYRVQIASTKALRNNGYFQPYITQTVATELHQGWYKYTVGNFADYESAKQLRDKIKTGTPFKDVFVSAYRNNERISVKDALTVTNQKWIK